MTKFEFNINFPKFSSEVFHFNLFPGLYGIYGESGVGKSDFLKELSSSNKKANDNPFEIVVESTSHFSTYIIQQNPDNQIIGRTIEGELAFNGECSGFSPEDLELIVNQDLERLPNELNSKLNPGYLSGGEKELINLLTAMRTNSDLLLIDDGLSFLSQKNKLMAIDWLQNLTKQGKIVIWATSEFSDLKLCDHGWELLPNKVKQFNPNNLKNYTPIQFPKGEMDLNFDNVDYKYEQSRQLLNAFNLDIKNIRSLGIVGGNGSGKTTIAGLVFNDLKPNNGQISLKISGKTDLKIGYVDQFQEHLIQLKTPEELLNELIQLNLFNPNQKNTFQNKISRFGIQWNQIQDRKGVDLPWATLRTISVVLLSQCTFDLLILDEPTFGLGWTQRVTLHSFLREMMTNLHFIIVSHDRAFVDGICDSVIDLNSYQLNHDRRITAEKTEA